MKRLSLTVYATVFLGCFLGKAQATLTATTIGPGATITTVPIANLSQFEIRNKLLTQNFFSGAGVPPAGQETGNFGANAKWNSMGSLNAGTQLLNGFRSQTNGRGLTMGFSVPTGGSVRNPFIQWIGNGAGVNAGSLEFRYAQNPSAPNGDTAIFVMAPTSTISTFPFKIPSFNYADSNAFIGQKQSGIFGSFGVGDTWSATGQLKVLSPVNLTSYGARQQFAGYTINTALLKDSTTNITSGVLDYGVNTGAGAGNALNQNSFKFRVFTDPAGAAVNPVTFPTNLSKPRNVWQSSVADGNVMLGRQDIFSVDARPFYLSVFDGSPITLTLDQLPVNRAAIYATSNTVDEFGVQAGRYAAVFGDLRFATPNISFTKYAILGIAELTTVRNNWAGYFVGNVGYTGTLSQISDKKFKTKITDESKILEKLMFLQPKNYYFDREKYKGMAFGEKLQHGLISQEVEKVFPELIEEAEAPVADKVAKTASTSYKSINYNAFIPMLIKGLQEQQAQIQDLKNQIAVNNTLVLSNKTALPTEIENVAYSLSQNVPNPFSEKTTISYTIPAGVNKAVLAIFDLTGKMIQQYNLLQGKNQLTINAGTLQAGMYLYSIIAEGQEVVSKRMVLTK